MDLILILLLAAALAGAFWWRSKRRALGSSCCAGGCGSCGGCAAPPAAAEIEKDFSDKKIVFFDIDGTLVDGATHRIPESTVEGIRKLRANGHLAFVNTGRTLVSIGQEIRQIGFDGYVCGCGTHIYIEGKEVFSRTFPGKTCVEVVETLRKLRVPAFFESPVSVCFDPYNPANGPEVEQSRRDFTGMGSRLEDFPQRPGEEDCRFDKFFCLCTKESDREGLAAFLAGEFQAVGHGESYYEVMPKGCSKAGGIRFLQEKFRIRPENCYAIGDSENDIDMLRAVSKGIAMGECAETILPYCSYHTAKVMEGGIYQALEHYGLI